MEMSNSRYKERSYWDERYDENDETHTEWLCAYNDVREVVEKYCKKDQKILMLGTGDSKFATEMYQRGFKNITNIDYSKVIVEKMSKKHSIFDEMRWICADMRSLDDVFQSNSFDVVLEKATIDSLLVDEKDFWRPTDETRSTMNVILTQIHRILKDNGVFISITFAQPHFRLPFLMSEQFQWSIDIEKLGDNFHYFIYFMRKGRSKNEHELDKFLYSVKNINDLERPRQFLIDENEDETFLNHMLL